VSLEGLRVVVTRAEHQAGDVVRALERRGARVLSLPAIVIADPTSWEGLDRALQRLQAGRYQWVAFTSANAVDRLFARLGEAPDLLGRARVAAVGAATARALRRNGVEPAVVARPHTAEALARALGRGAGRVLLPRVEQGPPLPDAFAENGWTIDEVAAYRNEPAPRTPAHALVEAGAFDAVAFMSPSAIDGFLHSLRWRGLGLGRGETPRRTVACVGPSTAAAARRRGLRVDVLPAEHTLEGLLDALERVADGR